MDGTRHGGSGRGAARAAAIARIRRRRAFRLRLAAAAAGMVALYPTVVWLLGVGEAVRRAVDALPVDAGAIRRELRRTHRRFLRRT